MFDAVVVANLRFEDRTGTRTTCVARRQAGALVYEVWQDCMLLAKRESNCELRAREMLNVMLAGVFTVDTDQSLIPFEDALAEAAKCMASFEASSDFHDDLPRESLNLSATLELRRILAEEVIENQDLAGFDFSGANLTGIKATRANLETATFYHACLAGADLQSARLRHADLRHADLRHAFLQGADLEGAQMEGADLRNANLRFACLRDARLCSVDLRGADLTHADARGADFTGANLAGCHLPAGDHK